jgi:hypothetical protein
MTRIGGLVLLVCMSCASIPRTTYQDRGFHFEITNDFKVGRSKFHKKNQSTYIPIYFRSDDLYAKISVVWLPGACNLDWELGNYTEGLTSVYKGSDSASKPQYSEYKTVKFGENDARRVDYIVPNDGPRVGSYIAFRCDSISVIIGIHSVVESKAQVDRCVELIEKTYRCTYLPDVTKR